MRRWAWFLAGALVACSRKEELTQLTSADLAHSDEELAVRVDQRLGRAPHLSMAARDVSVSAEKGVVTLRGAVSADDDRKAIHDVAAGAPDVTRVINELVIVPGGPPRADADRTITASALRAVRVEPSLRGVADELHLQSSGGIVTARRAALNDEQQRTLTQIVESVPGVIVLTDAPSP
jgi:osmotically-inducible protein OsmY